MKSISAFRRFTKSFALAVCTVLALTFCIVVLAQTDLLPHTEMEQPDLCPDLGMCIKHPQTGKCIGVPCPFSTPIPTPMPTPVPIIRVIEDICTNYQICTVDPVSGRGTCRPGPCPFSEPNLATAPGAIMISEFRFRGPNGVNDEFIEIYNNTYYDLQVATVDGSEGWSLVGSDGIVRFVIPVGTVIPQRSHYLAVNSLGYSLGSYPAGDDRTATADASYAMDIPDGAGIALFATTFPSNFKASFRFDAAGYDTAPALYREGAGFPFYGAETFIPLQYSFYRNLASGWPQDTDNNAADFVGVDNNFYNTSQGQHLGAPGPENLSSPVDASAYISVSLLDPIVPSTSPPNRVRDTTPDPANNSMFGTLSIRRTITNHSNQTITRLRFRIIDITTFPYASGNADLRPRSTFVPFSVTRSDGTIVTVRGTSLETPPSQPNGGGFNSSLRAHDISLSQPLAPGQSIHLQFLLGVQQGGNFRFIIGAEALK
jgi:hypothetical protein